MIKFGTVTGGEKRVYRGSHAPILRGGIPASSKIFGTPCPGLHSLT